MAPKLRGWRAVIFVTAVVITTPAFSQKRSVTAADCVTVRDLQFDASTFRSTIQISPDGHRIAYTVRSPNIDRNSNDIELYVRDLPGGAQIARQPLLAGDISGVRWRPDGKHLTALVRENGRRALEMVDPTTGTRRVLVRADADIAEYSMSEDGNVIAYATFLPAASIRVSAGPDQMARGYRIPFQSEASAAQGFDMERLFVTRRTSNGWSAPERIVITSPLNKKPLGEFISANAPALNPALSPDGRKLLLSYFDLAQAMPEEWQRSGAMQFRMRAPVVQMFFLLVAYDIATGKTLIPLKSPWVSYGATWSKDGRHFVASAAPEINSEQEKEAVRNKSFYSSESTHVFWVDAPSGAVETVASHLANPFGGSLALEGNGDVLVQIGDLSTIKRYSREGGKWHEVASWHLPLSPGLGQVTADSHYIIGSYSNTLTPPQLFVFDLSSRRAKVLVKLNPQFDDLALASAKEIHWKTSTGFDASGVLLLPPGYQKGKSYPLVIQTKPFGGYFACSNGDFPSFVPQPLANAGILYLGPGVLKPREGDQEPERYYPKDYPGGVAEAAFWMDYWDTGVEALARQGLVDKERLGIIGFSRTGWYTEFILSHSKLRYRAATAADNVEYSLGEYWLLHESPTTIKSYDSMYGGPPYGDSLKNWLEYSISFNAQKIHTPLLMEEMGDGRLYDNSQAPPINLATTFELFTALNRLHRPVELYYYPTEDHTPQHPKARLATWQRNVDWYRFWLQGYERPHPEDPQQYVRWRALRELQEKQAIPAVQ